MAIEDTKELRTVNSQAQAQELIDQDWTLLGLFDRRDGNDQYVEYHLGRAAELPEQHGMLLSKHTKQRFGLKE